MLLDSKLVEVSDKYIIFENMAGELRSYDVMEIRYKIYPEGIRFFWMPMGKPLGSIHPKHIVIIKTTIPDREEHDR